MTRLLSTLSLSCMLMSITAVQAAGAPAQDRAATYTQLAAEYLGSGNLPASLEAAQAALDANGSYAPAHMLRGLAYMSMRRDNEAEQSLREAVRLDPKNSQANNNYGWFLCERRDPKLARPYFDAALVNPLYQTPEVAMLNAGTCLNRSGDFATARDYLLKSLRERPDFRPALYQMAVAWMRSGRPDLAASYLDRMGDGLGDSPEMLQFAWQVAQARGEKGLASRYADLLRQRYPDAAETQQLLVSGSTQQ